MCLFLTFCESCTNINLQLELVGGVLSTGRLNPSLPNLHSHNGGFWALETEGGVRDDLNMFYMSVGLPSSHPEGGICANGFKQELRPG